MRDDNCRDMKQLKIREILYFFVNIACLGKFDIIRYSMHIVYANQQGQRKQHFLQVFDA